MKKISVEYCKFILEKVSFDPKLFEKELLKAMKVLVEPEISELLSWVKQRFKNPQLLANIPVS